MDKKMNLLRWHQEADRAVVSRALQKGGMVVSSTDTVLGLMAMPCPEGFAALNRIKARMDKPYLLLIGDTDALEHLVALPVADAAQRLMDRYWPGPLTLIMRARSGLPEYMISAHGTIAIRMPQHAGLLSLLHQFPQGLFSTSANLSGNPVATAVSELDPTLVAAAVHIIIDDEQKADAEAMLPSTIVDCTGSEIRIVREGVIARDEIERGA